MTTTFPVDKQARQLAIGIKLPDELSTAILDVIHTAVHKSVQDTRQANQFPEYMNQTLAAKYLGVSSGTIIKWEKADIGFPTIYIEGSKHYSKTALDKWMAAQQK